MDKFYQWAIEKKKKTKMCSRTKCYYHISFGAHIFQLTSTWTIIHLLTKINETKHHVCNLLQNILFIFRSLTWLMLLLLSIEHCNASAPSKLNWKHKEMLLLFPSICIDHSIGSFYSDLYVHCHWLRMSVTFCTIS